MTNIISLLDAPRAYNLELQDSMICLMFNSIPVNAPYMVQLANHFSNFVMATGVGLAVWSVYSRQRAEGSTWFGTTFCFCACFDPRDSYVCVLAITIIDCIGDFYQYIDASQSYPTSVYQLLQSVQSQSQLSLCRLLSFAFSYYDCMYTVFSIPQVARWYSWLRLLSPVLLSRVRNFHQCQRAVGSVLRRCSSCQF